MSKLTVEDVVKVTQMIVDANPLGYTLPADGEARGYIVQDLPTKGDENSPWVWYLSRRAESTDPEKKGMFTEDLCEGTLQEVLQAAKDHGFL